MARKKSQKRPTGQIVFVILGLLVAISMATSYICSFSPPPPTPTSTPTLVVVTPTPIPTSTPTLVVVTPTPMSDLPPASS